MKGDVKVLNKEKYAKEIVELATNGVGNIAIVNNKPCCCDSTTCFECDFQYGDCDYDSNLPLKFLLHRMLL